MRQWLLALLATIVLHNLEEASAIAIAPHSLWGAIQATGLALAPPPLGAIYAGLALFAIVPAIVLLRTVGRPSPAGLFLSCMIAAMVLANAVFPHLALTVLTGRYTPGAISAVVLSLPIAGGTLHAAWKGRWTGRVPLAGAIGLGVILLPLVLLGFWALQQLVAEVAK
jgi:hypothetical protein